MQQADGRIVEISQKQAEDLAGFLKDAPDAPAEVTIGETRFFRKNTVPKVEEPSLNRHERRKLAKELSKE